MTASFTASEYEALPAGLYGAQLVSIERQPGDQFGDYLRWTFNVRLADGSSTQVGFNTSTNTGPRSNAYKWATGLLGHKPAPGQAEDLTGLTCQLAIVVNDEGFNRIESVMPGKAAVAAAPAATFPDSPPARLEPTAASADLPF
jgi:hypothetical protein